MTAETSRKNGYVSLMPSLKLRWPRFLGRAQGSQVTLDARLDPEGLSAHMSRDIGLSDASLLYDSRHSDREP